MQCIPPKQPQKLIEFNASRIVDRGKTLTPKQNPTVHRHGDESLLTQAGGDDRESRHERRLIAMLQRLVVLYHGRVPMAEIPLGMPHANKGHRH